MPKLSRAAPTFPVADVGATIRWYETELGFNSYPFPENPPYVFASVGRDDVEIMFQRIEGYQKPDLYQRRNGGVWDAYIRMEGVKEFYEAVRDKVEITMPLRKQAYGDWEFEVKDPNGYILVFSELTE
ncbi:MAG TPA: VOC family protein [Pyrinomonadaceae bacterium]|nr:VOC family protein [Pyrinomonadaceae bacterium]